MVFAYNERGRAASGARVLTGKRGAPLGAGPWARARWALRVNRHSLNLLINLRSTGRCNHLPIPLFSTTPMSFIRR